MGNKNLLLKESSDDKIFSAEKQKDYIASLEKKYKKNASELKKINGLLKTEIKKRKSAETELHKSEERFRIVTDYIHDWEYWLDTNKNFIFISPSCELITEYKPENFFKDEGLLQEIIHPEDRNIFLEHEEFSF